MAETQKSLTGLTWRFSAGRAEGKLDLKDDGNGNLTGTIDNQQVLGLWDSAAGRVTFLRIVNPADPSSFQVYTGYHDSYLEGGIGDLIVETLSGTYQAFSGTEVTPQRNVFTWGASRTQVA